MKNLNSFDKPIGAFFTPLRWAKWVVDKYNLYDRWLNGAIIFDPTAGQGVFLEVFIQKAVEEKNKETDSLIRNLFGNEKEPQFVKHFVSKVKKKYDISFPMENFTNEDILFCSKEFKADIILGNPPWMNFNDLPTFYKENIKPLFFKYGLISNSQKLLLGSARIDIAALIISKAIKDNLRQNGEAYFFAPLSIFLNDGAHKSFREYSIYDTPFFVKEIYDFAENKIFNDVSTRYCMTQFIRNKHQKFPVNYFVFEKNKFKHYFANPVFNETDPLTIFQEEDDLNSISNFKKIRLPKSSKPRQGVNTCGANSVFIFDKYEAVDNSFAKVNNKQISAILPKQFLFPLIVKNNFGQQVPTPEKWILIPHNTITGKPVPLNSLKEHKLLYEYLLETKETLIKRKGTLIQSWIKKGFWWALLGVGSYSFKPIKICWESYGKKNYSPKIYYSENGSAWQGNQAMHAYIPLSEKSFATDILEELRNPIIEMYLKSHRMEGTCNWAQPGKISKLIEYDDLSNQETLSFGI